MSATARKRPPDPRGAWRRGRTDWGEEIGYDAAADAVDPTDAPDVPPAQLGLFTGRPVPSPEFLAKLREAYNAANIASYRRRIEAILADAEREVAV